MSRLDRLGSAKAVAQVGAVIGREFSHELLAKVAGRDEETLQGGPAASGRRRPAGQPPARCGAGLCVQACAGARRRLCRPAEEGIGSAARPHRARAGRGFHRDRSVRAGGAGEPLRRGARRRQRRALPGAGGEAVGAPLRFRRGDRAARAGAAAAGRAAGIAGTHAARTARAARAGRRLCRASRLRVGTVRAGLRPRARAVPRTRRPPGDFLGAVRHRRGRDHARGLRALPRVGRGDAAARGPAAGAIAVRDGPPAARRHAVPERRARRGARAPRRSAAHLRAAAHRGPAGAPGDVRAGPEVDRAVLPRAGADDRRPAGRRAPRRAGGAGAFRSARRRAHGQLLAVLPGGDAAHPARPCRRAGAWPAVAAGGARPGLRDLGRSVGSDRRRATSAARRGRGRARADLARHSRVHRNPGAGLPAVLDRAARRGPGGGRPARRGACRARRRDRHCAEARRALLPGRAAALQGRDRRARGPHQRRRTLPRRGARRGAQPARAAVRTARRRDAVPDARRPLAARPHSTRCSRRCCRVSASRTSTRATWSRRVACSPRRAVKAPRHSPASRFPATRLPWSGGDCRDNRRHR